MEQIANQEDISGKEKVNHNSNYSSRKVSRKRTREGIVSAMQSNGL